jgi:hypothetical protein
MDDGIAYENCITSNYKIMKIGSKSNPQNYWRKMPKPSLLKKEGYFM